MLRLAADENFNGNIVRGLRRRSPDLDIIRVQDVGLLGADDASVLEWAAKEGRVVVRHISTLADPEFAIARPVATTWSQTALCRMLASRDAGRRIAEPNS